MRYVIALLSLACMARVAAQENFAADDGGYIMASGGLVHYEGNDASIRSLTTGWRRLNGQLAIEVSRGDSTLGSTDFESLRLIGRRPSSGDMTLIYGVGRHRIESTNSTSILVGGEIDGPGLLVRLSYEHIVPRDANIVTLGIGHRF